MLGLWQLVLLAITIRSALISIRDMNQMMAVQQQQQTLASNRSGRLRRSRGRRICTFGDMSQAVGERHGRLQMGAIGEAHLQVPGGNQAENSRAQQSPAQQYSAECIVAAQHASEIIKAERSTLTDLALSIPRLLIRSLSTSSKSLLWR